MVAQYAKRHHIKYKAVMATKIQGGSMSQQNVIWSVTRSYTTQEIEKNNDATIGPRSSIQNAQKGTNPNHANKGVEVEHGGNRLITDQWWKPLTNVRETTIN